MNTDFRIRANRLSREAFAYLGQARQVKRMCKAGFLPNFYDERVTTLVQLARQTLRTAVLYRQLARS